MAGIRADLEQYIPNIKTAMQGALIPASYAETIATAIVEMAIPCRLAEEIEAYAALVSTKKEQLRNAEITEQQYNDWLTANPQPIE